MDTQDQSPNKGSHLIFIESFNRGIGSITKVKSTKPGTRSAVCTACGETTQSDPDLPFFESRPLEPMDVYYDLCRGTD